MPPVIHTKQSLSLFPKASITCFLAALVLVPAAQAHGKHHTLKAKQVFLDAANRMDLRTSSSPPFGLSATIKVTIQKLQLNGTYLLLWDSQKRWSEKIVLPGYQRIRVRGPSGFWQQRNLDYEIPSVVDLDDALNFTSDLRYYAKVRPGKLKSKRVSGANLECSRVYSDTTVRPFPNFLISHDLIEEFCLAPQQAELRKELFPKGASNAPNLTSVEYSDFAPFGTKDYPRTIRLSSQGKTFLTFSVRRIALLFHPPASDFAPPAGGIFTPSCASFEAPKLIKKVLPVYPRNERFAGQNGHVVIYAMIATDGSVKNAKVIFSAGSEFDAAALAAVRQWHYRPASCTGKPYPIETYITVYFAMK